MAASKRRLILEAVRARLQEIDGQGAFETDAGARVFTNETPNYGPNDPATAIAMTVGDDQPEWQQGKVLITLPLILIALATASLGEPWKAAEQVLADLKRAMELDDRRLGGLLHWELLRGPTQTAELPEGATTVGVQITYIAQYEESWGSP